MDPAIVEEFSWVLTAYVAAVSAGRVDEAERYVPELNRLGDLLPADLRAELDRWIDEGLALAFRRHPPV